MFAAVTILMNGCSPVLMRNPKTGEVIECRATGSTPMINRAICVSDYSDNGWIKTTSQEEQARSDKAKSELDQVKSTMTQCKEKIAQRPEVRVLTGKIAFDADRSSFSILANQMKPSDDEKAAISAYADLLRQCAKLQDTFFHDASTPSPTVAVIHSANTNILSLLVALYNGKITYGEFANYRQQIRDSAEVALAQVDEALKKDAAEAEARAHAIAAQNAIAQAQIEQAWSSRMNATSNMMNAFKPNPVPSLNVRCTSTPGLGSVSTTCH